MSEPTDLSTDRRNFLGTLAAGTLAIAATAVHVPALAAQQRGGGAGTGQGGQMSDAWLQQIKSSFRQFFDATSMNDGFALVYAMNFIDTAKAQYTLRDDQITAVVGLRHFAIPIAFNNTIWAKYKLGEFFKVNDAKTKAPAIRNQWYMPAAGELPFPGAAWDKLQPRGTLFTVCNVALTLLSGATAEAAKLGITKEKAKEEWLANMLPGAVVAPSGVLAANRAQEAGCSYCYAG